MFNPLLIFIVGLRFGFSCAARALRLLATHHVFVEVSPNVFANNSLSSILDTGKSTEALFTQCVLISPY